MNDLKRRAIRKSSALMDIMSAPPDAPANPLAVEWLRVVLENNPEPERHDRPNPVCLGWHMECLNNNPNERWAAYKAKCQAAAHV
jgi:hypothetical protein